MVKHLVLKSGSEAHVRDDRPAGSHETAAVALGRKIYLLCGSDAGGERAAALYSLIGTARRNDIDPQAYLRYVLERIADHLVNRDMKAAHVATLPR